MKTEINEVCIRIDEQIGIGKGRKPLQLKMRFYRDGMTIPFSFSLGGTERHGVLLQRDWDSQPRYYA